MDSNFNDHDATWLFWPILLLLAFKGRDIWNWLECMFSLKYGYC